jgi:hypothetical protein
VRRANHTSKPRRPGSHRNWIVEDYRGPKVFIRQFTFSYFEAAIREADRLARTGQINPTACFGVHRIEYRGEAS